MADSEQAEKRAGHAFFRRIVGATLPIEEPTIIDHEVRIRIVFRVTYRTLNGEEIELTRIPDPGLEQ